MLVLAPAAALVPQSTTGRSFTPLGSTVQTRTASQTGTTVKTLKRQGGTPVTEVNSKTMDMWDSGKMTTVQGGSLKTWSFPDARVEGVQVGLRTEGRPLNCNIELWQGPDNTPYKLDVYLEDGALRPFKAIVPSPGGSNSIALRNTGQLEFPINAVVEADTNGPMQMGRGRVIQGGAVHTIPFDPSVQSVGIQLVTDGRPMTARVELMQGPYNDKQVMEIYTEDGMERTFFCVVQTPGVGNVVRIVNTATVEFPLTATVEPLSVRD